MIITIIVMLILAGVSLNALVGDNGIIETSEVASLRNKFALYKEELENSLIDEIGREVILDKEDVTVLNNNIKKYIPSIDDNYINYFVIVAGELYYLGDNNLEEKACASQNIKIKLENQTVEDFVSDTECKAIESVVKSLGGTTIKQEDNEGNEVEIGEKLKSKGIGVANWKIIVINNEIERSPLGTGWTYIKNGTNIDNIGILQNGYIINYETLEVIKYDKNNHVILEDGAGIKNGKDYLICNIDPSSIEKETTDFGTGVSFYGYSTDEDGNFENAFNETAFLFDGEDDYIKIAYNDTNKKELLAENGFTFEFYGVFDGGTSYQYNSEQNTMTPISSNYKGLFCYWDGIEANQAIMRFGLYNGHNVYWNAHFSDGRSGDGWLHNPADPTSTWNISYGYDCGINQKNILFMSIRLDCSNPYEKEGNLFYDHALFVNGIKVKSGDFEKAGWDAFVSLHLDELKYFCVGRSSMGSTGRWHYSKMETYALRLYAKALTDEELKENYNETVAYHNLLVQNQNGN